MKKSIILESIIIFYIILFLYTGISKIIDYSVFKEQIATSPLLMPFAKSIALAIPWIEFLITLLLIIPKWRLKGLYASLSLMTIFTVYIISILLFNKELPCSCGGVIEQLSWTQHILFNSVFIVMAVLGVMIERQIRKANKEALSIINAANWSMQ